MTTATAGMIDAIGQSITVGGSPVTAIWDDDYAEIDTIAGTISSSGPAAHCKTSDVSSATKGTAVVRNSVNYVVTAKKPDGTGMTTLVLKKA